jgi:adenylate cyclase
MERRLSAIVCADVAGYSRMMGSDEAGTHAAFKAHRSAVYPVILNHGGRLVKNTGDGFLLEFPSVVGAIESAIGMQALMAERNGQLPADRVMQFRLGVHMGDVMADEDEVFGDGVNIAVRLEAIAAPGGVAVSAKAYHEASKHLSTVLVDAGIHRFKNIAEPVHVWTWEPARSEESPGREIKSVSNLPAQHRTAIVGVLPFANLSDSADEYFSDGLTEDLIHALSLQSFFRVLSRNPTFAFKGKNVSTRLIAREIDATYLIQGSVRRAGAKIRVTAELIAPENGEQLWAGRYDRDIGDLFAMQDEITTNLCTALATEIYRAEASAPARSSNDLTAWDRFLRGLSHYYKPTKADYETSIDLFREAIALDPSLSIARAYLATILTQGVHFGWIRSTSELWREALDLAESSVRLDPRSSFAFSILSYLNAMEGHHDAAMEAARKAVGLNAYDMGARGVLGICHMMIGEHRQAIELFSAAVQQGNSDPRYQWPVFNAFSHYLLRQYDASLSWAREALYLNPNHLQVLCVRAAALAQLDRTEEAAKAVEVLMTSFPTLTVERHLKNFRWRAAADTAHYRDGLVKAGVPLRNLTLVESGSKLTANS